jgi:hypothetical protein
MSANAEPPVVPSARDTLRAKLMFGLAFVHLLTVAGLVHRATSATVTPLELDVMYAGLLGLWPVFALEAFWGALRRGHAHPRGPVLLRALLVTLMPPWRMGLADPRTGLVWFPRLGWRPPGKELSKRLNRAFAGPMILFAALILPLLILEYVRVEQVRHSPALALALDIGIAAVWVAFATEFVLKASAHTKPLAFAQERWLDAAIVALPMLQFVLTKWLDAAPLARLVRLARALSPEQLSRMERVYRLQGVATKAWHAFLLIEGVGRLLGFTPEKRLAQVEEQMAELEEQLAELRAEADELQKKIAARAQTHPPAPSLQGGGGAPSDESSREPSLPRSR